jgi:hypothetical protein
MIIKWCLEFVEITALVEEFTAVTIVHNSRGGNSDFGGEGNGPCSGRDSAVPLAKGEAMSPPRGKPSSFYPCPSV